MKASALPHCRPATTPASRKPSAHRCRARRHWPISSDRCTGRRMRLHSTRYRMLNRCRSKGRLSMKLHCLGVLEKPKICSFPDYSKKVPFYACNEGGKWPILDEQDQNLAGGSAFSLRMNFCPRLVRGSNFALVEDHATASFVA